MNVVNIELGRIIYLFVADEVRPIQGVYAPDLMRMVAERYGFPQIPPLPEGGKGGVRFSGGRMVFGRDGFNIPGLEIYNDAVIIETLHTDQSETVLNDILSWSRQAFGFREPISPPKKFYESYLVVDFGGEIQKTLSIFDGVIKRFSSAFADTYGRDMKAGISAIQIAADTTDLPISISPYLKGDFTVMRRVNQPFDRNRFWSAAPFPTQVHIDLLNQFEAVALGEMS